MNEANISTQLRDIKPLMEIPDSSYYVYWGLIALVSLFVVLGFLWLIKYLWENRKINLAKGYLEALKAIDWKDSKHAAYEATQYARLLATDSKKEALFKALETMLEQYKYKKSVKDIDDETRQCFDAYIKVCDGSL